MVSALIDGVRSVFLLTFLGGRGGGAEGRSSILSASATRRDTGLLGGAAGSSGVGHCEGNANLGLQPAIVHQNICIKN